MVVPLDVLKTSMQTSKVKQTAAAAALAIVRTKGPAGLWRGLRPTAIGYFMQGAVKFGGYESLKRLSRRALSGVDDDGANLVPQLPLMIGSAAIAEFAACSFLCPLEVAKLRMQTDIAGARAGLVRSLSGVVRSDGVGALYRGFSAIALRQVPYTIVKLVCYDAFASAVVRATGMRGGDGDDDGERARATMVSLGAGLCAGACAALVSQPADVLLTRMCGSSATRTLSECVIATGLFEQLSYLRSIGLRECFSGLGPRLTMIALVNAAQFGMYDAVRVHLGVGRSYQCAASQSAGEVAGSIM